MEQLEFRLPSEAQPRRREPVLVGVVGSGNCEVLVEGEGEDGRCAVTVKTSARGFAPIWEAVLRDFAARARPGD